MDGPVRTTPEASNIISGRNQLAGALHVTPTLIDEFVADPASQYINFSIPKSNGDKRDICAPQRIFRNVLRTLLVVMYRRVVLPPWLHGGIRGRSIFTNAKLHVRKQMVATLDIRKFYPSTTRSHLEPVIAALGFEGEAANDVCSLVLLGGTLPQGSPTSCLLANLAFAFGDMRFLALCRRRELLYSRYVDDIAVSGSRDFRELKGPFIDAIEKSSFTVAAEKIHFMPKSERQVVTGLVVNDSLRPTRQYLTDLKDEIRRCLSEGALYVALSKGITVSFLKANLTGRVAHVHHGDKKLGRRLRGMLCGVDWHNRSFDEEPSLVAMLGRAGRTG